MKNIASNLSEYNKFPYEIQNLCILVEDMPEKLSELITRRIGELNISNAELARRTGLSRGYIGNIVNETAPTQTGQYDLSKGTIRVLARELKITEAEILSAMGYMTSRKEIPEKIAVIGYDDLSDDDIRDIVEFIEFKKSQKSQKQ